MQTKLFQSKISYLYLIWDILFDVNQINVCFFFIFLDNSG